MPSISTSDANNTKRTTNHEKDSVYASHDLSLGRSLGAGTPLAAADSAGRGGDSCRARYGARIRPLAGGYPEGGGQGSFAAPRRAAAQRRRRRLHPRAAQAQLLSDVRLRRRLADDRRRALCPLCGRHAAEVRRALSHAGIPPRAALRHAGSHLLADAQRERMARAYLHRLRLRVRLPLGCRAEEGGGEPVPSHCRLHHERHGREYGQ